MQKQKTTQFYTIILLATFVCYALYVVLFGTLSTTMAMFVFLLILIVLLVGALSFFPALALGPIAEFFQSIV